MAVSQVLILGCGFTGSRVARRLLDQGVNVIATTREVTHLADLTSAGAAVERLEVHEPETLPHALRGVAPGVIVLHSVPVVGAQDRRRDPTPELLEALGNRPSRVVYLSTTGVYGKTLQIDENTPPASDAAGARLRLRAEGAVSAGPWSSLVLRPAAIYGPGRGVHESMRQGKFRLAGDGSNFISRIHVEDLASITTAALLSDLTGVYPVADQEPCTSYEMAQFCAKLLDVPMPPPVTAEQVHHTRRANRRVDGRAILERLGLKLAYPTYRTGVPASVK